MEETTRELVGQHKTQGSEDLSEGPLPKENLC